MERRTAIFVGAGLLALALWSPPVAASDDDDDGSPTCIEHSGEARYGAYGYDHLVHLRNGCDVSASCRVSTDVTPEEQQVEVASGARVTVVTRRGSPARAFTPRVACELRR